MIVAYPTKWTSKLPALPDVAVDANGVQKVVINVNNINFGKILPKDHVDFIDRQKPIGKRCANDNDDDAMMMTMIVTVILKNER